MITKLILVSLCSNLVHFQSHGKILINVYKPPWLCTVSQLCLTLCDPMNCSLPGFSFHGIFQGRILEWAAISSSRGSSRPRDQIHVSCVSCVAGGFFTTEPPGKPLNYRVCLCLTLFLCLHWFPPAAAAAKSLQSCPTLCDPIDGSPPGSPVPGILQARTLEWVAISFSNA